MLATISRTSHSRSAIASQATAKASHPRKTGMARMPSIASRPRSLNSTAEAWRANTPSCAFVRIQKHFFSSDARTPNPAGHTDGLAYLKENGFSESDIEHIKRTTHGVTFKVIPLAEGNLEGRKATRAMIDTYFRKPIESSTESSALGGEKVLLLNPANPEQGKPDSSFLMIFDDERDADASEDAYHFGQDPHLHGGPRHLDMWIADELDVVVGGADKNVLQDPVIHFTRIRFPAGHLSLSFRKNMLHGFTGKDVGAISTHFTDAEELEEAKKATGATGDVSSKEVMATLTQPVDKDKIKIIGDQTIPWHVVADIQSSRGKEDL